MAIKGYSMLIVLLASLTVPQIRQQPSTGNSHLVAMILDDHNVDGTIRLWIAIKNEGATSRIFCRRALSYVWTSQNPNDNAVGETKGSIHGCGDNDHDPFWLLLPGEYRFDSVEVKKPSHKNYDLEVEVELLEKSIDSSLTAERTVRWTGPMEEALAFGEALKSGRFK